MPDSIKKRVRRGAELLDRVRPGWAFDVIPDLLAMDSERFCILGQLYGDFADAVEELGIAPVDAGRFERTLKASRFGFEINPYGTVFFPWIFVEDWLLDRAWRAEIRSRFAAHHVTADS